MAATSMTVTWGFKKQKETKVNRVAHLKFCNDMSNHKEKKSTIRLQVCKMLVNEELSESRKLGDFSR